MKQSEINEINLWVFFLVVISGGAFLGYDYYKNKDNSIIGSLRLRTTAGIAPMANYNASSNTNSNNSGNSVQTIRNPDSARITPTSINNNPGRTTIGPAPQLDDPPPPTHTGPSLYKP
ncbi:MAG: hypothetical protein WCR72_01600 [Bacteroidota bacterium]